MRYRQLIKASIKKQRVTYIGITILMFIITTTLCMVLSVWDTSTKYETAELERIGYGDITSWLINLDNIDDIKQQVYAIPDTEKVEEQPIIYSKYMINEYETNDTGVISTYNPERQNYKIFQDDLLSYQDNPISIQAGEVYVSPGFQSLFEANIGDSLYIKLSEDGTKQEFIIKGYFEDPIMGSTVMGMKTLLINDQNFASLQEKAQEQQTLISNGFMLHIDQREHSSIRVHEYQQIINDQTDMEQYTSFMYQKATIINFMMTLQNMFSGFLFLFIFVLFITTMIVIGHNISSTLEQEYTELGLLKALGYTKSCLIRIHICQYMCVMGMGVILGIPLSFLLTDVVNQVTLPVTGIRIPTQFPIALCGSVLLLLLVFIIAFIYIKMLKISNITPIRAIRGNRADVYFQSRCTLPIYHHPLDVWLALRQIISHKTNYIGTCLVTLTLVFFLSFVNRLGVWIGADGKNIANLFSPAESDIGLKINIDETKQGVEDVIRSYTDIQNSFHFINLKGSANDVNMMLNVISDPDAYQMLKGKTCHYANEVVLTQFSAETLNVSIGSYITLGYGGNTAEYIVSGINQCANDMGANISISELGFQRLSSDQLDYYTYYVLKDASNTDQIEEAIQETYGDQVTIDDNTWSGLQNVVSTMTLLNQLMYMIVTVFVFITVLLSSHKVLYMERKDMGIYKALGYTSKQLRRMFAFRFGIVALIGSGLGIMISSLISDPFATIILQFCGISEFTSSLNIYYLLMPGIIITVLFIVFAYISSRKIKEANPTILISE